MAREWDKMIAGELYDPLDAELVAARERARDLWIQPPFYCAYGASITLGKRVFFNFNCVVLDVCPATIGDFTLIAPALKSSTPLHPMNAELRRRQELGKPITIASDAQLGDLPYR